MTKLGLGKTTAAVALVACLGLQPIASVGAGALSGAARVTSTASPPRTDAAGVTWLCRPGLKNNPCTATLDSTAVRADGSTTINRAAPAATSAFDCFYVYPTESQEQRVNADLQVQAAETSAATRQASRFSQPCQVWAPMYRQATSRTLAQGLPPNPQAMATAYQSLLPGWQDYLANYNHGRPIIFIGHSQGASLLINLLSSQVDSKPALLRQMVSAILVGGNVIVPTVAGGGGSFRHIPACRYMGQTGCVIAYSTYPSQPPADSAFARPGKGVSKGQGPTSGVQVLCVNPAALSGGTGVLDTYFPAVLLPTPGVTVTTPWVEYLNLYTATCQSSGDATWLEADRVATPGDKRPSITLTANSPMWGFHSADVNLPLGNLLSDVQAQEAAYQAAAS